MFESSLKSNNIERGSRHRASPGSTFAPDSCSIPARTGRTDPSRTRECRQAAERETDELGSAV